MRSLSLRGQGYVLLGLLVALGFAFIVAFLGIGGSVGWQLARATASRQSEVDAQLLETGMVNQETGLRGYQLTANAQVLEPYTLGRGQVASAIQALDREARSPRAKASLARLKASVTTWQAWAEQQISAVDLKGPRIDPASTLEGKSDFDQFRSSSASLVTALRAEVSSSDASARTQSIVLLTVLGLLMLAATAVVGAFSYSFFRGTLTPIGRLIQVAEQLEAGDASAVPDERSSNEVGRLSRSLAAWQRSSLGRLGIAQAMVEVSSEVELARVVDLGMHRIQSAMGAEVAFVRLATRDGTQLFSSWANFDASIAETDSPTIEAFQTKARLLTDIRDQRWSPALVSWAAGLDLGPVLAVPMVSGGEVIGVVACIRHADQPPYSAADLQVADIIVPGIAAGVHVSQLFAGLNEANQKLAEASRVKSEFLASMSHELRTPLNAILGFSELLTDAKPGQFDDASRKQFIMTINSSGQHLLGLINDILDLAKIEAGKMEVNLEEFDLAQTVRETLDAMAAIALAKDIRLVGHAEPGLNLVADPRLMRQVLLNMISNAIKFTPDGGAVTVSAHSDPKQAEMNISVADTGVGIAAEDQSRIFGEFEQISHGNHRVQQGTGLGLSLTRRMLEMQGGRIWVESELGQGATFRAVLPLRPAQIGAIPVSLGSNLTHEDPLILVIDDDPAAASLITHQLAGGGFRSAVARDGRQALEMARTLRPAAITLDVILPDLDGWEVLRTLKMDKATESVPVVVVSVLDDKITGRALGASDYFVKPVDPQALLAGLARHSLTSKVNAGEVKVLVVDDESNVLDLMSRVLEPHGFTVLRADSGTRAIDAAEREKPDAILLDLMMPDMSGFEVIRSLRSKEDTAAIPILVVTAKDLSPEEKEHLSGSVASVLSKGSLAAVDIVSWVRQALRSPSTR